MTSFEILEHFDLREVISGTDVILSFVSKMTNEVILIADMSSQIDLTRYLWYLHEPTAVLIKQTSSNFISPRNFIVSAPLCVDVGR